MQLVCKGMAALAMPIVLAGSKSAIAQSYAGASGTTLIDAAGKALGRLPADQQQPVLDVVEKPGNYVVRVTFQRVVTRTDKSIYVETIKDQGIYQEFFEKLSKSVFIEAQEV